jgi:hypothetical protein
MILCKVIGGEGGPQTDKTPVAKSLYKTIFWITTFGSAFYQSNLSTNISFLESIVSKDCPVSEELL